MALIGVEGLLEDISKALIKFCWSMINVSLDLLK